MILLRGVVVARLLLHALYLPVFEGPDEPFHLARASSFAAGVVDGWHGDEVDGEILAAVAAHPCAAELRSLGCPGFSGRDAAFNILEGGRMRTPLAPGSNYQAHQPPLYYFVAGALLRLFHPIQTPESRLLLLRLFSVGLVAAAVAGPLRLISRRQGPALEAGLLFGLLVPGAAESLARVSSEAAVLLWCAVLILALDRGWRPGWLCLLLAAGPLIKLTAVPVVVFGVLRVFQRHQRWAGLAAAAAALAVVPIQMFRGWRWGGTLEINSLGAHLADPLATILFGILHSAYTFLKTALWLGGLSVFRPPIWLLMAAGLLICAWLLTLRPARPPSDLIPHGAALLAAVAGFVAFAIGKRQVFGIWGAVGGWYVWGWYPWLVLATGDLLTAESRLRHLLVGASSAWIVAANISWFIHANTLYGLP